MKVLYCRTLWLSVGAALSACGKVTPLTPPPGQSLPPKPLLASSTPDAERLLTPPTSARVTRVDELLTRSMPRRADRFDLPPASGGPAPAATVPPADPNQAVQPQ